MKNQFPEVFLWKNCLNIAQSIHITKSVWNLGKCVITTQLYKKDKTENTKMQIHKPDKKNFIIDFNVLFYYCFFFFHRPSRYLGTSCAVTWTELASATWCWCVTSSPWWSGRKWRTSVPLLTSSIRSWGSVFGPQAFFNITLF